MYFFLCFLEDAFADPRCKRLTCKIFRFNWEKIFSNYQVEIGDFTTQEQTQLPGGHWLLTRNTVRTSQVSSENWLVISSFQSFISQLSFIPGGHQEGGEAGLDRQRVMKQFLPGSSPPGCREVKYLKMNGFALLKTPKTIREGFSEKHWFWRVRAGAEMGSRQQGQNPLFLQI